MRVDTRPRRKNAPRIAEKSAPGFLQWTRGRACIFHFLGDCEGRTEAMHLDFAGGKGVSTKVADRFTVPGCTKHHKRQTDRGWETFLREAKLTKEMLIDAAARYWKAWPGRIAWERKLDERNA
jgi:hypothetical protein